MMTSKLFLLKKIKKRQNNEINKGKVGIQRQRIIKYTKSESKIKVYIKI